MMVTWSVRVLLYDKIEDSKRCSGFSFVFFLYVIFHVLLVDSFRTYFRFFLAFLRLGVGMFSRVYRFRGGNVKCYMFVYFFREKTFMFLLNF